MSSPAHHMDTDMDDSPWLSDSEDAPTLTPSDPIALQEWNRLSTRYSDAGYRDGITAGKNGTLQRGFDQGFSTASQPARTVGTYRALAASLLSLLTTTSGAKHASKLIEGLGEDKGRVVAELRELVLALGRLDEEKVLGVDEEAREHAKSHESELSEEARAKVEMRALEASLEGIGGAQVGGLGLEECRTRLEALLEACEMGGVLSC